MLKQYYTYKVRQNYEAAALRFITYLKFDTNEKLNIVTFFNFSHKNTHSTFFINKFT